MSKRIVCLASFLWAICCPAQSSLQSYFQQEAKLSHFNGAALIAQGDSLIFSFAHDNVAADHKDLTGIPYDIGSISKQFTATAILQLVHEKKIQLDDPVNKHLGPLGSDRWEKVRVHHLLCHSGGIPSLYQTEQGLALFFPEEAPIHREELIQRFKKAKLLFKPGKKFSYSNSGYILLATLIEQVSGMEYGTYMEEKLFKPFGLSSTSFGLSRESASPYYGYLPEDLKKAPIYHPSWFVGAGGIYSTAKDLSRWVQMLLSNKVLPEQLTQLLFQKHMNAGSKYYGYGWQVSSEGWVEHDGGNAGFISFLHLDPQNGQHIIVLTNRSFEDIHMFGKSSTKVQEWVDDSRKILSGKEIPLLSEMSDRVVKPSSHWVGLEGRLEISKQNGKSYASIQGLQPSRILAKTPIDQDTDPEFAGIAAALASGKYRKLGKYCDGEMKFVVGSGLMRIGMKMLKRKVGQVEAFIPYAKTQHWGLIRMEGREAVMDLIVYFDEEGRMAGIFEKAMYPIDQSMPMRLYPLEDGSLYLDGFPYGEPSLHLKLLVDGIRVEQQGRLMHFKSEEMKK